MSTTTKSSGLQPIGVQMPAAVRQAADAALTRQGEKLDEPNRVAFRAFLDREIAAAMAMEPRDGIEHLAAVRRRVRGAQGSLIKPGKVWASAKGLHAWDFTLADGQIAMAERAIMPDDRRVAA